MAGVDYKGGSRVSELDQYDWARLMGGSEKEGKKRQTSEQKKRVVG